MARKGFPCEGKVCSVEKNEKSTCQVPGTLQFEHQILGHGRGRHMPASLPRDSETKARQAIDEAHKARKDRRLASFLSCLNVCGNRNLKSTAFHEDVQSTTCC